MSGGILARGIVHAPLTSRTRGRPGKASRGSIWNIDRGRQGWRGRR